MKKAVRYIISFALILIVLLCAVPGAEVHAIVAGDILGTCNNPMDTGSRCAGSMVVSNVIQPTCTETGRYVARCDICGRTESGLLAELGHNDVTTVSPTCLADGSAACSRCGRTVTLPKTGHKYKTVSEATCTEDGKQECIWCGLTAVLPKKGHNYKTVSEATCTEDGKDVCSRCGEEIIREKLGHDYLMAEIVFATCTEEGSMTEVCDRCGDENVQIIPPSGHKYTYETIEPACTEDGKKTGTCQKCGDVTEKILPALGHDYPEEWTVTKESTITEEGEQVKICGRCGDVLSEAIPKKSLWPVIGGIAGGAAAAAGLYFGIKKLKGKKKIAGKLAEEIKKPPLPKIETKVILISVKEQYDEFVELLKSKHFLKVVRCEAGGIEKAVEEGGPDLLIVQVDDESGLETLPSAEILGETPAALIIPDELYGENAEKLGSYRHIPGMKSPNQGLVKLVLPVLKPDLSSDEELKNIGIAADLLGIPLISTLVDLYVNGREIKETLEESEELSFSDTATLIADIADILGLDAVSGVAGLVDDVDKIKAAADDEAGTNQLKKGAKGAKDIVDVVGDLIQ